MKSQLTPTCGAPQEKVFSKNKRSFNKSSVTVKPLRRKELKEKMATKMSRRRKSGANSSVSPVRRGNTWPDKETHPGLSPKALPTILSDTSPQEEVGDEVRQRSRSRRSGAEQGEEEEEVMKQKSRRSRGASSSGAQEETLLQEGEGLTVRSLYR